MVDTVVAAVLKAELNQMRVKELKTGLQHYSTVFSTKEGIVDLRLKSRVNGGHILTTRMISRSGGGAVN